MDRETNAKIENLISSYENRVLVLVTLSAIVIFSAASFFTICFTTRDAYDPAKGDRPLITYQVVYNGQQLTRVAAWTDKDGSSHYAKEPIRFAGINLSVLVLALSGLGIAKGSYDIYSMLTDRYKRRLMSDALDIRVCAQQNFYGKE